VTAPGRPVIVCFAGGNWDGNPHSRHHLMRRFARNGFEVLFVEGVPMRSVVVGERHELRRVLRKLRQRPRLRRVEPHLVVLRPAPIPPLGRLGRVVQTRALQLQILAALRILRLRGPRITWFSLPNVADLRGRLGEIGSLFYYQDRYTAFSHVDAGRLREDVVSLARGCDVVVTSAQALAGDLEAAGARPTIVPHGVEIERFAHADGAPSDLDGLERPLVGYVGILDDFVSFDHIRAVADRLERGTVVLIGPSNVDMAPLRHPRIRWLGARPYTDVPRYVHAFGCCLIPFALNELTEGVNPIKLREYLAAGRPVVSTPLPEVRRYEGVASLSAEPEGFADAVVGALAPESDDERKRSARRASVAGDSWDAVSALIVPLLTALLPPDR
jgi:glycosyltransferase involved in cell wall biosynthesis